MNDYTREKYVFGSIFLIANKLQVIGDQYLADDGLTTKQWFLSVMISQFQGKPPSLSEVAELMGSSRQNVKQLALKLEEKGLLIIEKDKRDARTLRLRLTEKSREFWHKRQDRDDRFIRELFGGITEDELAAMNAGIGKLNAVLEQWGNKYEDSEAEE